MSFGSTLRNVGETRQGEFSNAETEHSDDVSDHCSRNYANDAPGHGFAIGLDHFECTDLRAINKKKETQESDGSHTESTSNSFK
jgi:hypothetical protein